MADLFAATSFRNKRVVVFGLARSGLACLDALVAGGAEALAADDSDEALANAGRLGFTAIDLKSADFSSFDALVLSPGVPLTHPRPHWSVVRAQEAGVPIIGDTEVFVRELDAAGARYVAVTGTNGKSTTTALIGHVLQQAGLDAHIGGNIGKAVFLLPPPRASRVYVLEMSSYQIDLTPSLKPRAGILLNLSPDHLDRHGDMAGYAAVKAKMFALSTPEDTAVISLDDPWCRDIAASTAARTPVMGLSVESLLDDGVCAPDGELLERRDGETLAAFDLLDMRALRGRHNWQNACAAYGAGLAMDLEPSAIIAAMASFPGLAHRMEEVGTRGAVTFINDSKATNADAAGHALAAFERIYWIVGGQAKQGGIDALAPYFDRIVKAYLIGEAAQDFARTLRGQCETVIAGDIATAVALSAADAAGDGEPGTVLLSPACASFDQFPDFERRGDAFRDAVHALDGILPTNRKAA